MKAQKDSNLEEPAEANRDKHINFLAEENNIDPNDKSLDADEDNDSSNVFEVNEDDDVFDGDITKGEDNGFFTNDDSESETKDKEIEDERSIKNDGLDPDEVG